MSAVNTDTLVLGNIQIVKLHTVVWLFLVVGVQVYLVENSGSSCFFFVQNVTFNARSASRGVPVIIG